MRRALLAAICVSLAVPAAAGAQFTSTSFTGPASAIPISTESLSARAAGEVSIAFHPDPASGCAALSGCAYSGTIAWNPEGGGTLALFKYRQRHRVHVDAELLLGENGQGTLTASSVQRAGGGQCGDELYGLTALEATEHGPNETFTLNGELSATRCAGPLPSDLGAIAPSITIATRRLEAGNVRLDFRTQRSFATHGFTGTLTSTLVVTVGRTQISSPATPPTLPQVPLERMRIVTEQLHLEHLAGSLSVRVAGTTNPQVCGLLDACGLVGTLTMTPKPVGSNGSILAIGPASRPYRDFLAALGLSDAGRSAGISVFGELQWADHGTVTASLHQSRACSDTAPLGPGLVSLGLTRHRVVAGYLPFGIPSFGSTETYRTRCPGPAVQVADSLAVGTVPRRRLKQRKFTIQLHGGGTLQDEGYDITPGGTLTLELRRGRISQQVQLLPAG
jgi:hypothetical protein